MNDDLDPLLLLVPLMAVIVYLVIYFVHLSKSERLQKEQDIESERGRLDEEHHKIVEMILFLNQHKLELIEHIEQHFLVQPCSRCHEFTMLLLEASPNGRSIHYQCVHCSKKMHAPACTPKAPALLEKLTEVTTLEQKYRNAGSVHSQSIILFNQTSPHAPQQQSEYSRITRELKFKAPAAPLPYEQTSRTPIPEAIRSEVWRRDMGKCVRCGSNQNLQFDHIIPVALGGATSVANLQLLCQSCNGSKGKKI